MAEAMDTREEAKTATTEPTAAPRAGGSTPAAERRGAKRAFSSSNEQAATDIAAKAAAHGHYQHQVFGQPATMSMCNTRGGGLGPATTTTTHGGELGPTTTATAPGGGFVTRSSPPVVSFRSSSDPSDTDAVRPPGQPSLYGRSGPLDKYYRFRAQRDYSRRLEDEFFVDLLSSLQASEESNRKQEEANRKQAVALQTLETKLEEEKRQHNLTKEKLHALQQQLERLERLQRLHDGTTSCAPETTQHSQQQGQQQQPKQELGQPTSTRGTGRQPEARISPPLAAAIADSPASSHGDAPIVEEQRDVAAAAESLAALKTGHTAGANAVANPFANAVANPFANAVANPMYIPTTWPSVDVQLQQREAMAKVAKVRGYLRKYTSSAAKASHELKRPRPLPPTHGTVRGFGNCVVCGQPINDQLFELMRCGHIICGSTAMKRGGCGRHLEATNHKKTCSGGPIVNVSRHIKLHGVFLREGSVYQQLHLSEFSPADAAAVVSEFRGAVQAFLKAQKTDGEVTVTLNDGCIEFVAQFVGHRDWAEVFQDFFTEANVEDLFPRAEFDVGGLDRDRRPGFATSKTESERAAGVANHVPLSASAGCSVDNTLLPEQHDEDTAFSWSLLTHAVARHEVKELPLVVDATTMPLLLPTTLAAGHCQAFGTVSCLLPRVAEKAGTSGVRTEPAESESLGEADSRSGVMASTWLLVEGEVAVMHTEPGESWGEIDAGIGVLAPWLGWATVNIGDGDGDGDACAADADVQATATLPLVLADQGAKVRFSPVTATTPWAAITNAEDGVPDPHPQANQLLRLPAACTELGAMPSQMLEQGASVSPCVSGLVVADLGVMPPQLLEQGTSVSPCVSGLVVATDSDDPHMPLALADEGVGANCSRLLAAGRRAAIPSSSVPSWTALEDQGGTRQCAVTRTHATVYKASADSGALNGDKGAKTGDHQQPINVMTAKARRGGYHRG